MFSTVKKVHFVGIGGIGMSGIAEILINQGFEVSGSDLVESDNTEYLRKLGAEIFIGHNEKNIENVEVVVYSSAVHIEDNPETLAASQLKIPIIRRAEMLAQVSRLNYCLAISGTHGKTTTTSMIGLILIKASLDPTVIVGGRLVDFGGTNARLGKGQWTVVEADEFDRSFLQLMPTIAVVNNIELEHLDIYSGFDDLKETFTEFANKVPFYGFVSVGLDDEGVGDILAGINKKIVSFGLSPHCDYHAENIETIENMTKFDLIENGENKGEFSIHSPGKHNVKNALAAISVSRTMGIELDIIKEALSEFHGIFRRFDILGHKNGALIVDDYAHHPTEVKAALSAARSGWDRRIISIFQPHTYTRTKDQYKDFGRSFFDSDILIVTDIYPAREKPIEGITGELISDSARKFGHKNVYYCKTKEEAGILANELLDENDLLITLGAGDIWKLAKEMVT